MKSSVPWPFNKKTAFVIRDDDVSYFTQPWMLDMLYSEAWRLGFKVSLAVIPYAKSSRFFHVPRSLRSTNKFFSISENRELVDYLLGKIDDGYVDIVQHGYTHARENGKPEFAINDFELASERLKRGRKILRETFKRDVTVFVAPHEGISRASWKSISQNGMCLCRRFTLGRFLMTVPLFSVDFHKLAKAVIRRPNPFKSISNTIIDLTDTLVIQWGVLVESKNPEAQSKSKDLEAQFESAKEKFLDSLGKGEAFVIAHHHWEYFFDWQSRTPRKELLACFDEFLNFVSSKDDVWKTTLSELCLWGKTRCA